MSATQLALARSLSKSSRTATRSLRPISSEHWSTTTTRASPRIDKSGKPIRSTRKYSDDVGKVFATVEGTSPSYTLTGNELYVRAVVTSTKPPTHPSFKKQLQQAWTQPVGWEARLKDGDAADPSLTRTRPSLTRTRPSLTRTRPSLTRTRPSLTRTRYNTLLTFRPPMRTSSHFGCHSLGIA